MVILLGVNANKYEHHRELREIVKRKYITRDVSREYEYRYRPRYYKNAYKPEGSANVTTYNKYFKDGRSYNVLYTYYLPQDYYNPVGYYSPLYSKIYYNGYGYNFYYG